MHCLWTWKHYSTVTICASVWRPKFVKRTRCKTKKCHSTWLEVTALCFPYYQPPLHPPPPKKSTTATTTTTTTTTTYTTSTTITTTNTTRSSWQIKLGWNSSCNMHFLLGQTCSFSFAQRLILGYIWRSCLDIDNLVVNTLILGKY